MTQKRGLIYLILLFNREHFQRIFLLHVSAIEYFMT